MAQQSEEINRCCFWVTRVSETVFSTDPDVSLRPEFEAVFKTYGEDVEFSYLTSFGRVKVTYLSQEQADLARANLNNQEFQGRNLKVKPIKPFRIGSVTLDLPQRTKQFLISPPASPPVDWAQVEEQNPCVDYSLVTALAKLQIPGETQELHEGNAAMPSIIVVTPEDCSRDIIPTVLQDSQQQSVNISALPPSLVHTARPPL